MDEKKLEALRKMLADEMGVPPEYVSDEMLREFEDGREEGERE